jgi:hypothetical protein
MGQGTLGKFRDSPLEVGDSEISGRYERENMRYERRRWKTSFIFALHCALRAIPPVLIVVSLRAMEIYWKAVAASTNRKCIDTD